MGYVSPLDFESLLDELCKQLTLESSIKPFADARVFEQRVREITQKLADQESINFTPHAQAFPDIEVGRFGIEVKFTSSDTWRSVANSVLETNRIQTVEKVYVVFGKMGGLPEVRWGGYAESVVHVRTSHVPRFEVEIGAQASLFNLMGVDYDDFRVAPMHSKMEYIRKYARGRLRPGERLWWLEDSPGEQHSLPIQARLYTKLNDEEKKRLRAEAVFLCPRIVQSRNVRDKYDDVALFLLTYHGVLAHAARDLFTAGSVSNWATADGEKFIIRALRILEPQMYEAARSLSGELFEEYWGVNVPPGQRIVRWLEKADKYAEDWVPSDELFLSRPRSW